MSDTGPLWNWRGILLESKKLEKHSIEEGNQKDWSYQKPLPYTTLYLVKSW